MKRKPFARHLQRVRKSCLGLPETIEKLSHGEPTFFVKGRVFAMFSNNHHDDGHVAVWLLPYVGSSGWIGVELDQVNDESLDSHIRQAWQLIAQRRKK